MISWVFSHLFTIFIIYVIVFALNLCTTFPTVLMLYGDDDDDEGDDDDNYDLFMWND